MCPPIILNGNHNENASVSEEEELSNEDNNEFGFEL